MASGKCRFAWFQIHSAPSPSTTFIDAGLGEYATQLGLARVRRLAVLFAGAACTLLAHHGDAGAIHLHIQNGNAWSYRDRQLQLQGPPELTLLTNFDIFSDSLGRTFHGFGGKRQPRQQFHLLAAVLEGALMPDRRQHASHAGREPRVLDVEFNIDRELTTMAVLTQVVRAQALGLSHRS